MDPVSLGLGIASLAGIAATTIKYAKTYASSAMNAKQSAALLVTELEALQANLNSLDAHLKSPEVQATCETSLKILSKKLGNVDDSKLGLLLWPLSEKEYRKVMEELRNFSGWMQFALTIDGCSMLSQTSENVLKVLGGQLESLNLLQRLQETAAQLGDDIQIQAQLLQDECNTRTRDQILDWLSAIDHNQMHNNVRKPRVEGTGKWLLEQPEFLHWWDETSGSNVLWCHGMQGSGKSVLAYVLALPEVFELKGNRSLVVDHLNILSVANRSHIAFFYFDYQDGSEQAPLAVLASLLKQICSTMPEIPKSLFDAHKNHQESKIRLSLEALESITVEALRGQHRTAIIMDALDECDKSRYRSSILQLLQRLIQVSNVHLFVTSRNNFQDIADVFGQFPQITVSANDSDLKIYMQQELHLAGVEDIVDETFANQMIHKVIAKARGMFLLAILHFRTVLNEPTGGAMEDALDSLTPSLDSAFQKTISRIEKLPENRKKLGLNALMWICHAKRALDVSELCVALSIQPDQKGISPKYRPSRGVVLECCQGLVTIDQETDRIHLVHYSVQEYLHNNSSKLCPDAETDMVETTLTYLLLDDFKSGPCHEREEISDRIEAYPFLEYASTFWGTYLKDVESRFTNKTLLQRFFTHPTAVATAEQINIRHYREEYWNYEEVMSVITIHQCGQFGLNDVLRHCIEQRVNINTTSKMGNTAVIEAASRGHVSTVKIMLDNGADPYMQNWYGNALHCAAEAGQSATIRQLVDYAFETLARLGADVDERDHEGCSILHRVADENCINIMDIVIKHRLGDLEIKGPFGCTPLLHAAYYGSFSAMFKLLHAGANPDARDDFVKNVFNYTNEYFENRGLDPMSDRVFRENMALWNKLRENEKRSHSSFPGTSV